MPIKDKIKVNKSRTGVKDKLMDYIENSEDGIIKVKTPRREYALSVGDITANQAIEKVRKEYDSFLEFEYKTITYKKTGKKGEFIKRIDPPEKIEERWEKKKDHIRELSDNVGRLKNNITRSLKWDNEKEFLTALIISVILRIGERIGNEESANYQKRSKGDKRKKAYGVSGFKKTHVEIIGNKVHLNYIGKKGVEQEKSFSDEKISKALKVAIKRSPSVFIFTTSEGQKIGANQVNDYLKDFNITAKGIRGWYCNRGVLDKLKDTTPETSDKKRKKQLNIIIKNVASKVGHGPSVLKNQYLMPEVITSWIDKGEVFDIKEGGYVMKEGGEVNSEKKSNVPTEKIEIGGHYSFKNDFGSFTSVKLMPVDESMCPSKSYFTVEITIRYKDEGGHIRIQHPKYKTFPISMYEKYMEDLKNRGADIKLKEGGKLVGKSKEIIAKYYDKLVNAIVLIKEEIADSGPSKEGMLKDLLLGAQDKLQMLVMHVPDLLHQAQSLRLVHFDRGGIVDIEDVDKLQEDTKKMSHAEIVELYPIFFDGKEIEKNKITSAVRKELANHIFESTKKLDIVEDIAKEGEIKLSEGGKNSDVQYENGGSINNDYKKWKRKNVTLRGMKEIGEENEAGAMLGRGLYTAALSNRSLSREYGTVYFAVNARPKNPKKFNTLNDWEIWFYNNLVYNYSKAKGKDHPDKRDFNASTTIEDEMQKLGYDGIEIIGREIVNFKPGDDVRYYKTEDQLKDYYERMVKMKDGGVAERFDLPEIKSVKDVYENIDKIIYQYSGRAMANMQVETYLNENNIPFVKDFLDENGIDNREKLNKYVNNRQAIVRKGKGKERSEFLKSIKESKTQMHTDNIIKLALGQSEQMDRKISKMDDKNLQDGGNIEGEAFKKWFNKSKVVDKQNNPQKVYHGTGSKFNKFNIKKTTQGIIWFTSSKEDIEKGEVGAQGKGYIMELYASIQNPAGWNEYEKYGLGQLTDLGYDGAILPDKDGNFVGFVFEPTQLKSATNNKGTFDPNNTDIRIENGGNLPNNEDFANSEKGRIFVPSKITKDEISKVISGTRPVTNGTAIQAVSRFLRRSESSSSLDRSSHSSKRQEEEHLNKYISENNLWVPLPDPEKKIGEGGEAKVYFYGDHVIKTNDSFFYASWQDYLNSVLLHNYFFPATSYELIGFSEYKDLDERILYAVVKQPFIEATATTDINDVKNFMSDRGFINKKNDDYYHPPFRIILEDLHEGNVLTKDGVLYFIDTVFYINSNIEYAGGGYTRQSGVDKTIEQKEIGNSLEELKNQVLEAKNIDEFLKNIITDYDLRYKYRKAAEPLVVFEKISLIDSIKPYQAVNEDTIKRWEESIEEGARPFVIIRDDNTIDGNHKLQAYKNLGFTEAPVLWEKDLKKFYNENKGNTIHENGGKIADSLFEEYGDLKKVNYYIRSRHPKLYAVQGNGYLYWHSDNNKLQTELATLYSSTVDEGSFSKPEHISVGTWLKYADELMNEIEKNKKDKMGEGGKTSELKPAYLMTFEEYQTNVSPLIKEFHQFVRRNGQYFKMAGYHGLNYTTWQPVLDEIPHKFIGDKKGYEWYKDIPQIKRREFIEEDVRRAKIEWEKSTGKAPNADVPKDALDTYNAYQDKFKIIFGDDISRVESDESKSNKRAVRRAIDRDVYKKMLEEGTLKIEDLTKISESVGVSIPKKVFDPSVIKAQERKALYDKIYSSMPSVNRDILVKMVEDIKRSFKPLEEQIYARMMDDYKKSINKWLQTPLIKREKLYDSIEFYDKIFKIGGEEVKIEEIEIKTKHYGIQKKKINVSYIKNLSLLPDWEIYLDKYVRDYIEGLRVNLIASIMENFQKITLPISEYKIIQLKNSYKGFEGEFTFNFKNGSHFNFKTQAISAEGEIQRFHFRYITDFTNIVLADESKGNASNIVIDFSDKAELAKLNNPFIIVANAKSTEELIDSFYNYLKAGNISAIQNVRKYPMSISYKQQPYLRSRGLYFTKPPFGKELMDLPEAKENVLKFLEGYKIKNADVKLEKGGRSNIIKEREIAAHGGIIKYGEAMVKKKLYGGLVEGFNEKSLQIAKEMWASKYSPLDIWEKTMWYYNELDRNWKNEIPDDKYTWKLNINEIYDYYLQKRHIHLDKLINHELLFLYLPEFKKYFVKFEQYSDNGKYAEFDIPFKTIILYLNFNYYKQYGTEEKITTSDGSTTTRERILLSEMQHMVQARFRFAKDIGIEKAIQRITERIGSARLLLRAALDKGDQLDAKNIERRIQWLKDNFEEQSYIEYITQLGEIEARDVIARMNLTKEERKNIFPLSSSIIPQENIKVTFEQGGRTSRIIEREIAAHGGITKYREAMTKKKQFLGGGQTDFIETIDDTDYRYILEMKDIELGKKYFLKDVIEHDKLFKEYSTFKEIIVIFEEIPNEEAGAKSVVNLKKGKTPEIIIRLHFNFYKKNGYEKYGLYTSDQPELSKEAVMLHEIEHVLQFQNRWISGFSHKDAIATVHKGIDRLTSEEIRRRYLDIGIEKIARYLYVCQEVEQDAMWTVDIWLKKINLTYGDRAYLLYDTPELLEQLRGEFKLRGFLKHGGTIKHRKSLSDYLFEGGSTSKKLVNKYYKIEYKSLDQFKQFLRELKPFVESADIFFGGIGEAYLKIRGYYDSSPYSFSEDDEDFHDLISHTFTNENYKSLRAVPQPENRWNGKWKNIDETLEFLGDKKVGGIIKAREELSKQKELSGKTTEVINYFPAHLKNLLSDKSEKNVLENRGEIFNENLSYLLSDKGQTTHIGPETGSKVDNGITIYKSDTVSYRYVNYVDGIPASAIQIMSKDGINGYMTNAYTSPSFRRMKYALEIVGQARKDFKYVTWSNDLSDSGRKFKETANRLVHIVRTPQSIETKERGGLVVGDRHDDGPNWGQNGGGVGFEIQDTGEHIEEEGLEANIPREVTDDTKEYTFTGANHEILDEILKLKGGKGLSAKVTHVKSGDIVICIKSVWDDTKRTYKGTLTQILSAINTSNGCKVIAPGAKVEEASGTENSENKLFGGKVGIKRYKGDIFFEDTMKRPIFEIADKDATINYELLFSGSYPLYLYQIFRHTELYTIYPFLRSIIIEIFDIKDYPFPIEDEIAAEYAFEESNIKTINTINFYATQKIRDEGRMGERSSQRNNETLLRKIKEVLTHEIQHAIQYREYRKVGRGYPEIVGRLREQARQDNDGKSISRRLSEEEIKNKAEQIYKTGFYEKQSRLSADRIDLDSKQRKNNPPKEIMEYGGIIKEREMLAKMNPIMKREYLERKK